jgi:hypothetical protein
MLCFSAEQSINSTREKQKEVDKVTNVDTLHAHISICYQVPCTPL